MSTTIVDEFGSFVTKGQRFSVLECRGPVRHRQELAGRHRVVCYAEQHLNWAPNPETNYGFVITGASMPPKTAEWAEEYLKRVERTFGSRAKGIHRGVRGSGNVHWVRWPTPTMLLEPLFLTNLQVAERLQHAHAREELGVCLAASIAATFARGLVGLSVGHAYRKPNTDASSGDPGALYPEPPDEPEEPSVHWTKGRKSYWDPDYDTEAEVCASVIEYATAHLVAMEAA